MVFWGGVCQPGLFAVKIEVNLGYSNEPSNEPSFDTETGTKARDEPGSKNSLSLFRNQTNDDSDNNKERLHLEFMHKTKSVEDDLLTSDFLWNSELSSLNLLCDSELGSLNLLWASEFAETSALVLGKLG